MSVLDAPDACAVTDACRMDRRCPNRAHCDEATADQLRADDLDLSAIEVLHCGQPMRYRNSHTCGAELTTTLKKPA